MTKIAVLIIVSCFSLSSCNLKNNHKTIDEITSNKNEVKVSDTTSKLEIIDKINKVPISPLPIGIITLNEMDSYNCSQDVNATYAGSPIIRKTITEYQADSLNKYGLNNLLVNIAPSNLLFNINTPTDYFSSEVIFAKRLPPKDGYNVLLCRIKEDYKDYIYYSWGLILYNENGEPVDNIRIEQQANPEDWCYNYAACLIDTAYNVHLKYFSYCEDGEETYEAKAFAKQDYTIETGDTPCFSLVEEEKLD